MKAIATIIRFAIYGIVGIFGGLILGFAATVSSGAESQESIQRIILWCVGGGLLIGLAMGIKQPTR